MKICTITCHRVYNYGASLQTYALQHYIESIGHEVEIIDFNPWFHRDRYNLFWFGNNEKSIADMAMKKFPPLQWVYLPYRAWRSGIFKTWGRKTTFDKFEKDYYHLTKTRYFSSDDLKEKPPLADVYVAGSDQIWNIQSGNGKEPGYYLDFGPKEVRRISYAASLGTSGIVKEWELFVKERVSALNSVSVREITGVKLLQKIGIKDIFLVLDPVFLLSKEKWLELSLRAKCYGLVKNSYILLYDFLGNDENMQKFTLNYAKVMNLRIVSINDFLLSKYSDININDAGPLEFLSLISNAACVIGSSFHATAFSVILEKEFFTFNLIGFDNSSRMKDFLESIGLKERLNPQKILDNTINYENILTKLQKLISFSKMFISNQLC